MKKIFVLLTAIMVILPSAFAQQLRMSDGSRKVATTMAFIENFYVDNVDDEKLAEDAVKSLLEKLDPHSAYISASEVKEMNEPLEGNFDGIGISFNMMTDTLYVIETIAGGPSEKVGILPGDKIIKVNDTLIAGIKMSTKDVMSRLRGKKGTKVDVKILRRGVPELIDFRITRDKIPIYSLDASYMVAPKTGYIRLSRFGATTKKEFEEACRKLQLQGMENLILDLESNGGGYLSAAIEIANEFLGKNQLIVYTEGNKQPKQIAESNNNGLLKNGKLIIMINEASASGSEIVAGAIQDWDRGIIVGRRSFGKGLVQRPFDLPDGSMIRLTVARYYTPTGRCIQKPYENGNAESYAMDVIERYNKGEMMSADSIHFPDSLRYKTLVNERTVYGGGGVMPDYFVPMDTSRYSSYHNKLVYTGVIYKVALNEVDVNRKSLLSRYPTKVDFIKNFVVSDTFLQKMREEGAKEFATLGEKDKNNNDKDKKAKEQKNNDNQKIEDEEFERSKSLIKAQIKAYIARDLYDNGAFFEVINQESNVFKKSVEIITNDELYRSILSGDKAEK